MPDQTWEQWVASHGGGTSPGGVAMPTQYLNPETQDRANIGYVLNPNFDTSETRMQAAEQNAGQGVSGSGFGSGTTARLLESEKLNRFKLGHEMLQPYLERDAAASNLATSNAARLNEIAAQGAQAMAQLQMSEAGQTARLNSEQAARLQQLVLSGQQAMAELQLRESGENARLGRTIGSQENLARMQLGGNILQTLLQASTRGAGGGNPAGIVQPGGSTTFDWTSQTHDVQPRPSAPSINPTFAGFNFTGLGSGGLGSSIDRILARYGLT